MSRSARLGHVLGYAGSLLLHLLVYGLLHGSSTTPEIDFTLELPSEVQFGLTEATAVASETAPQGAQEVAVVEEPAPAEPVTPAEEADEKEPKSPLDAGPLADAAIATDAAVPDAALPHDAAVAPEQPVADPELVASADAGPPTEAPREAALAAFAPAGAQIALRVHMGSVRESPLAEDVRTLLDAIPDWRLIVDGSGLDPLRDLERLFLATPDLKRSSLVVAGQYLGGEEVPRRAVASLAKARGVRAAWRKRNGLPVAPWPNADSTARLVALIAPGQFAITRPDDLPRVLLVARALAERAKDAGGKEVAAGDALLALGDGQVLALTVEGARLFARGNLAGVPERVELSVRVQPESGGLESHTVGTFESPEAAAQAQAYWARMRDRFAGHPLVALIGLREPLVGMEIAVQGTQVHARTLISVQQARVLLGFVRSALSPSAPLPGSAREPKPAGRAPGPKLSPASP